MSDIATTAPATTAAPDSNGAMANVPSVVDRNDNVDMDALKAFSQAQRLRRQEANVQALKQKIPEKAEVSAEQEEEETEETLETKGGDPSGKGEEESTEESDQEDSEEVDLDLLGDEEQIDGRRYVVATAGDKSFKLPKGAKLSIEVDGETKSLPVSEVMRLASGNLHVEQKTSELGRRESQLKQKETAVLNKYNEFHDRLQVLVEAANGGHPEEVVALFAEMSGQDPNKAFENLIASALEHAEQLAGLTERERQLQNELRRFKFAQKVSKKAEEREQKQNATARDKARVEAKLTANGLTWKDWFDTAHEVKAKIESGEITETPSGLQIVDIALRKSHQAKVKSAISKVSKKLEGKENLFKEISSIVLKTEAIAGSPMTADEIAELVRVKKERYKAALHESLSRKAELAKKAGSPISKPANSKQVKKKSATTLADHRAKYWND